MPWAKQFNVEDTLSKAMKAFWMHGYEGTSLQDLLRCMSINKGSFYDTYKDKRSLFLGALRMYDVDVRKARLHRLERTHSAREAIRALFEEVVETALADDARSGCFLTNTALELAPHDPEIGRVVADSQREIEAFFRRMIEEGQATGEVSRHVDSAVTARAMLGALIGLLVLSRSRPEEQLLRSIASDAVARLS